ncbi:chemerin-like receptor 2 [Brienomyrus brachyistius]|uniref:chemerin-like receptor 2 n=1 Tax=Brienomyrus brachyistius TaxID=42636 RepID=UPI0020B1BB6C|nr:chemerin-like receptor 2 [Brienomyrus brachyistius]
MESVTDFFDNYSYIDYEYGGFEDLPDHDYSQREVTHIISVVVYCTAFVLGVFGNAVVIWVTTCKSRPSVNSVWLLNLAVADFIFVLSLPITIDYVLRDFHWGFGVTMCKLTSFVSVVNMYASVLFVTVLSLDRYISLVHHTWSQRHRTVCRAWIVCGGLWFIATCLSMPALVFRDTIDVHGKTICFNNFHDHDPHKAATRHIIIVVVRTTVGFLLPFTAITVTSVLLAVQASRPHATHQSNFSQLVLAIILAFFFCWAPFHIFCLMELSMHITFHLSEVLKVGFPLVTSLGFFNSCVNPVLYVLLGQKVRKLLKRSCLRLTKHSLRELSHSVSATESVLASGAIAEPLELTLVQNN